jgi:xanthine dehydrogenase small subunit
VELGRAEALTMLLDWLRLVDGTTGTKEGLAEGRLRPARSSLARARNGTVAYEPVNSRILLAGQADGAEVITVEDLGAANGRLHQCRRQCWSSTARNAASARRASS